MALFKRALWHSGLTYKQTCGQCKTQVEYTDYNLDYRPWYADGFIICPTCKRPLRHRESYAINESGAETAQSVETSAATSDGLAAFCSKCGNKFGTDDKFCGKCGAKRA